jgi:hypothetical protein
MSTATNLSPESVDSDQMLDLGMDVTLDASSDFYTNWSTNYEREASSPVSTFLDRWQLLSKPASGTLILLKVLWASPWSLWGLAIGIGGLLTGGSVQRRGRLLEFWGGFLPFFLKYFPFVAGSPVATFGHVVLGRCPRHLAACRPHQLIHVKQYECWGPLFVPTYIACWAVLWCLGKRPYYDNPFEREAFDKTGW